MARDDTKGRLCLSSHGLWLSTKRVERTADIKEFCLTLPILRLRHLAICAIWLHKGHAICALQVHDPSALIFSLGKNGLRRTAPADNEVPVDSGARRTIA
jgi:hypothetical protein